MQLHEIKSTIKKKFKKRIGRGGKRGSYSGRGIKGQKARAGHRIRPEIRDIIKKLPKKRGYRFSSIKEKPKTINVGDLSLHFKDGEKVTPKTLMEKGLLKIKSGKIPAVKILGKGESDKKFLVENCQISESARKKIS
ncbi:MAG: uL15 family ribosomal protein [Patescibacteria group bacterium]|mgnify:CR=1 FL=1